MEGFAARGSCALPSQEFLGFLTRLARMFDSVSSAKNLREYETVLGIDPGLTRCGWGVLRVAQPASSGEKPEVLGYGTLGSSRNLSRAARLLTLHDALQEIFLKYQPSGLALEEVLFNANVSTAMTTAQLTGVVQLLAAQRSIPVSVYTPTRVKSSVTGFGAAGKEQVRQTVRRFLDLSQLPQVDAADALAVAICHVFSGGMRRSLAATVGENPAGVRRGFDAAVAAAIAQDDKARDIRRAKALGRVRAEEK